MAARGALCERSDVRTQVVRLFERRRGRVRHPGVHDDGILFAPSAIARIADQHIGMILIAVIYSE
ncbi:hypothetical protein A6R72_16640 [Xanthomonas translucens pv. graminis]|jgi:hypothetical protein|nr:hypothetical protein A6R72_16640 [Xanthomonas translucens pv. graminis]